MIKPDNQMANMSDYVHNADTNCVMNFIKKVWNEHRFAEISDYVDDQFIDHSMPYSAFQNRYGLLIYLDELAKTIIHKTEIIGLTTLDQLVVCHVQISVSSLPNDENAISASEIFCGYRLFKMNAHKIIEHWDIL